MNRFNYVDYDNQATTESEEAKALCEKLEHFIETKIKNGREKSLALTKLEETYMWIGKSIRAELVLRKDV